MSEGQKSSDLRFFFVLVWFFFVLFGLYSSACIFDLNKSNKKRFTEIFPKKLFRPKLKHFFLHETLIQFYNLRIYNCSGFIIIQFIKVLFRWILVQNNLYLIAIIIGLNWILVCLLVSCFLNSEQSNFYYNCLVVKIITR